MSDSHERTPYPYQSQSIDFVRSRHRSIVAHEMGLGKTMIAVLGATMPALVVCPAHLIINWRREIEEWRPEDSRKFKVVSYADRDLFLYDPKKFATVIADEVHYIKNPESRRSKWTCGLLAQSRRSIALSGTLVPNRPIELWPILFSMRMLPTRYRDYFTFARRFCGAYEDEWGEWNVRGATHLPELREILAPHVIRFEKSQVLPDLPDKTYRVIALDLPPGESEKEFSLDEISRMEQGVAMEVMSTVLKEQGLRKVPYVVRHVKGILDDGVDKLILFAHHREVIANLERELKEFQPVTVMGGMTSKRKQLAVDVFQQEGSAHRVFIGQTQAAGTGLTLTAGFTGYLLPGHHRSV